MFDSREYEWADLTVLFGGRDLLTIRGIKFNRKKEREEVYAKGSDPYAIQSGNNKYDVELKMLQSDFDAIELAVGGDIFKASVNIDVVFGNPSEGVAMRTHRVIGFRVTEDNLELNQGDKFAEITVPGIAKKILKNV